MQFRLSLIAALALSAAGSVAAAQPAAQDPASPAAAPANSQAAPNVSATGQHMPAVGASKSPGVTPLDQQEEQKMRKDTTICKGC